MRYEVTVHATAVKELTVVVEAESEIVAYEKALVKALEEIVVLGITWLPRVEYVIEVPDNQPHIQVEWDPNYFGGDYNGTGSYAYVPVSALDNGSVEKVFEMYTGQNPCHIVHYSPDEAYTKNGEEWQGGHCDRCGEESKELQEVTQTIPPLPDLPYGETKTLALCPTCYAILCDGADQNPG